MSIFVCAVFLGGPAAIEWRGRGSIQSSPNPTTRLTTGTSGDRPVNGRPPTFDRDICSRAVCGLADGRGRARKHVVLRQCCDGFYLGSVVWPVDQSSFAMARAK
ncbi:hypothetical protein Rhe02_09830 [Rhizocola hellebori]|uniref:Uncharacterized protein n=1 Tax=Rhizocola hellebori TaxID=1392758 RepID=A0A8J3Q3V9_9ACTN|nr:hypothetical protein Rhe02_09830 [Rhizocola hellebori]